MIKGPVRATVDDFEEIVNVADTCFPRDKEQGGMLSRWPHVYRKESDCMRNLFILRDGKKIVACAGYVDQTLDILGRKLRAGGVTAVCTLPDYRCRGMMSTLMNAMNSGMQEEGYAFAELGGLRRRYNHFGYENASRDLRFGMRTASLKELGDPPACKIVRYQGEDAHAEAIFKMHSRDPFGLCRDREKNRILLGRLGWETYVALKGTKAVSYAVLGRGGPKNDCRLFEFGGAPQGLHAIFAHLVSAFGTENITVESPVDHPMNSFLYTACNGWSIVAKRMVKILDLAAVMEGFGNQMAERYRQSGLKSEVNFSLEISGSEQCVLVGVSPGGVEIASGRSKLRIELPELEMVRFLFGMGGPADIVPVTSGNGFLRVILPLDFYVWSLEEV